MKRVIFLFLDGVGIGTDDPQINPLAAGDFPTLDHLLDGHSPTQSTGVHATAKAEFILADANLGVPGRPQSATGQTAILTGINAPQRLGEHYGPRPDARVRSILDEGSIFRRLNDAGKPTLFSNPYPEGYFAAVKRGKRLLSAVPYAATVGSQTLLGRDDLYAGRGIAADFTNQGWRDQLGYMDVPIYTPQAAGAKLWEIAQPYAFTFFEHWMTDLLGHRSQHAEAVAMLERFDGFLGGLLEAATLEETMIIVSSDHGNVEDCSHRKHTENPAFTLLLGAGDQVARRAYAKKIRGIDDFAAVIFDYLDVGVNE